MNEVAALTAVKDLIDSNKETLVQGFVHQGVAREIKQITISSLTPAIDYYFIAIYTDTDEDLTRTGFGTTTALAPSQSIYGMIVEVSDYVVFTSTEDELYEEMDSDFRKLCDRIIKLLRESYWITDANTSIKFKLMEDRRVTKENLTDIATNAAEYHSMCYCRISFQLIDECTDDTTLYE